MPSQTDQTPPHTHNCSPSQQIYVLSADGSSLFLLDPSKPSPQEEPPAYHSIQSPHTRGGSSLPGQDGVGGEQVVDLESREAGNVMQVSTSSLRNSNIEAVPTSPRHRRSASRQSQRSIGTNNGRSLSQVHLPGFGSSASLTLPNHAHTHSNHPSLDPSPSSYIISQRQRANTTSETRAVLLPAQSAAPGRTRSSTGVPRPRPPQHSSSSPPYTLRTVRVRTRAPSNASAHARYAGYQPGPGIDGEQDARMSEHTPLLGSGDAVHRQSTWKEVWCGVADPSEDQVVSWGEAWRRFWRPVGRGEYWRAALHLLVLNFPFALFVWPPLLVGTLVGTVLLITLPLGAAVWWLTLIIARSAARLEITMQRHHHPFPHPHDRSYHPIFHRVKERSTPPSPTSMSAEAPSPPDEYVDDDAWQERATGYESEGVREVVEWEKRFIKCSYAMFCDHYSYSALSYFLLIKPLITLFSSIALLVLLPIALATVFGLPVYLRAVRWWGKWQAGVAFENL